jgi:hypothetical protein
MSEAPEHDHHERAAHQEAARSAAHDAADRRREHRHRGTVSASDRRWRFADAVQAARALGADGTS